MVKLKFILINILFVFSLLSCQEEPIGQTPTNKSKPSPISDITVQNISGGAIITYALPVNEADISYVKAVYMSKGKELTVKSSVYQNFVKIEGLGSTDPLTVNLYTYNHSNVSSDVKSIEINPLTPPVYGITQSFTYRPDFGGLNLSWDNPTGNEVIITLLGFDDVQNDYFEEEFIYTSTEDGNYSFRGFESKPIKYGLFVRDKYYNYSDTVFFELTPIYETKIKTDKFGRVMDIPADNKSSLGGWSFEKMWDGIAGGNQGWHTSDDNEGKLPLYFTWDLGLKVQLSRFKLWHRTSIPYGNQNIKKFEVWGALDYEKGKDKAYYSKNGAWKTDGHWELLGVFEIKKPSGDDNVIRPEDTEAMNNGFEFMLPTEAKACRYLRFSMISNFSGGTNLHISEIQYWGDDSVK